MLKQKYPSLDQSEFFKQENPVVPTTPKNRVPLKAMVSFHTYTNCHIFSADSFILVSILVQHSWCEFMKPFFSMKSSKSSWHQIMLKATALSFPLFSPFSSLFPPPSVPLTLPSFPPLPPSAHVTTPGRNRYNSTFTKGLCIVTWNVTKVIIKYMNKYYIMKNIISLQMFDIYSPIHQWAHDWQYGHPFSYTFKHSWLKKIPSLRLGDTAHLIQYKWCPCFYCDLILPLLGWSWGSAVAFFSALWTWDWTLYQETMAGLCQKGPQFL